LETWFETTYLALDLIYYQRFESQKGPSFLAKLARRAYSLML